MDWNCKQSNWGLHSPGGRQREEKDPGGGRLARGLGGWLDVGEGGGQGGVEGDPRIPVWESGGIAQMRWGQGCSSGFLRGPRDMNRGVSVRQFAPL